MELNEIQLSSYYHPNYQHQPQQSPTATTAISPTVTTNADQWDLSNTHQSSDGATATHMVYPHSVPPAVTSQFDPAKRKRGRPRKYFTPEQALAAKKAATATYHSSSSKYKKDHGNSSSYSGSSKKSHLVGLGNAGQDFTPHVINVNPGEDIRQKIMMFMQQSKREMCILSATGTISSASLSQPATSGGQVTYEGCFHILSLSGSYVRTELGGRSGGLSVSLSSTGGQFHGGGVCGPLKAASAVQVLVATFLVDTKKDVAAGIKVAGPASKLPSPPAGEGSFSSCPHPSTGDVFGRNPNHQTIGGSHFMIQSRGMHTMPSSTEWRTGSVNMELTGRGGQPIHQSQENGNYDQIHD